MRFPLVLTLIGTAAAYPIVEDKTQPLSTKQLADKPGMNWNSGLFGDFHVGSDGVSWHPVSKDGKFDPTHSIAAPPGFNSKGKAGQIVNIPQGWTPPAGSSPPGPPPPGPPPPNTASPQWGSAPAKPNSQFGLPLAKPNPQFGLPLSKPNAQWGGAPPNTANPAWGSGPAPNTANPAWGSAPVPNGPPAQGSGSFNNGKPGGGTGW